MTERTLNFCVIGAGRAGLLHARNLARRIPATRVAALCDSNPEGLRQAGAELGVTQLFTDHRAALELKDIDAVVVVTPTFLHCDIACLAARQGKHIFLEKPMALNAAECRRINAAARQAKVALQIGFMRRFDEEFLRAKAVLDAGDLGRVMIIKSTGRGPGGPGPWMYDLRQSNGIIAEVNSHDLDTLRWLTGLEFQRVFAQGHNFKCPDAREAWPDFYDNVVAQFGFAGGAMGTVDGTCPAHYGYDARVEVLCENGVLFIGSATQAGFSRITREGVALSSAVKSWRTLFKDAYLAEMEHFVDCIRNEKTPRVTGVDGLRAVEAVVAINQSIRTGQPVELTPEAPE
jgi:myo-inositol 2-dehydrogenase/D-chiro-inositol 1-dehydrogenase/scyllo-inositol 2-dehydrogenase (NAD+)